MMMNLEARCPFCGKVSVVTVNEKDYEAWQSGALVQNAFPYLSANDREILVSGICEECWEGMFSTEDNDCDGNCEECGKCAELEDKVDETGFDPYEGCYTYDC